MFMGGVIQRAGRDGKGDGAAR
ncbi:hypothetical protein HOE425_320101 [Hoeflea sp. EC-HK425]|nr:hypothetical protein HOE425_320101 [Hoeflea sp. EC-HK425]